ncbi:MAG: sigma-70 family RNA polymerase sigma factor [Calditrichales bacterium]|nr:MAG: sigma-70 family RNA polymerase sigma factor [Calditrichales bacterium]
MTDTQLVQKAKKGDKTALAELISKYSERIYNLSLRILRNKEDAEDILQETFLTVIKKLDTFDGRSSFFTWVYRIATNASLMKLRKKKLNFVELPDNPDFVNRNVEEMFVDWSQNPSMDIQNEEIRNDLQKAIDQLSEIYRSVFILRDIEDLSIKETSKILGITEENVKIRLRRARLFLREEISHHFEESVA